MRVYFDSPVEDPVGSDPLEPDDYDPFKLDAEEYKNLNFKWVPFDHGRMGSAGGPETSALPPGADEEVLVLMVPITTFAHPRLPLLG